MDKLNLASKKYGLKINTAKTKCMVFTKNTNIEDFKLKIINTNVERVFSFRYLQTGIHSNGDACKEIQCRIEQARVAFCKIKKYFCSREINMETKTRLVK